LPETSLRWRRSPACSSTVSETREHERSLSR
jgi:hypothetical protein